MLDKKTNFKNLTDLLLIMASRNENYNELIKKNHKKKVILIDRFTESTLAYQHFGMGINKELIFFLNKIILKNIKSDFTFINIVNKSNLILRLKKRINKNRYDAFNYNFYNKVQKGYLKLSKNKKKYLIINSNDSISKNKSIIINKINKILKI